MISSRLGNVDVMALLLQYNANVNASDEVSRYIRCIIMCISLSGLL